MLKNKLANYSLILASGSPRRQQFFKDLDLDFEIRLKEIEEVYPPELNAEAITNYLAELKASAFECQIFLDFSILFAKTPTIFQRLGFGF